MNAEELSLAKVKTVNVSGVEDTIFNHCMKVKRKMGENDGFYISIFGINLPKEYWHSFYKMLWCKYLKNNSEELDKLPIEIQKLKDFNSTIEGKEFSQLLRTPNSIPVLNKDILQCNEDIICNLVNCNGVAEKGLNQQLFIKYPYVKEEYSDFCGCYPNKKEMLGQQQLCEAEDKLISNIFCKTLCGNESIIDYNALKTSLENLREEAMFEDWSIAFDYGMGSSLVGGDWNKIYFILQSVFANYPFVIYKK